VLDGPVLVRILSTQYFDIHAIECFKHSVAQAGVEYSVEACVSIRGPSDYSDVQATLKTEGADGHVSYISLARFNFCSFCLLVFISTVAALNAVSEGICIQNLRMHI
jgi:hypothetical protein